jgi:hypothetical protein
MEETIVGGALRPFADLLNHCSIAGTPKCVPTSVVHGDRRV